MNEDYLKQLEKQLKVATKNIDTHVKMAESISDLYKIRESKVHTLKGVDFNIILTSNGTITINPMINSMTDSKALFDRIKKLK